jgi:hypothetical protein
MIESDGRRLPWRRVITFDLLLSYEKENEGESLSALLKCHIILFDNLDAS